MVAVGGDAEAHNRGGALQLQPPPKHRETGQHGRWVPMCSIQYICVDNILISVCFVIWLLVVMTVLSYLFQIGAISYWMALLMRKLVSYCMFVCCE